MVDEQSRTQAERNKALVSHLFEAWFNQGDLSDLDAMVAPDFVLHSPTLEEPGRGPQALRDFVIGFRTGFPDVRIEVQDEFAEGDRVAVRWQTTRQTHTGPYQGIPPTGRSIVMTGLEIFRIEDGKLKEVWLEIDALSGLQQMGVVAPSDIGPLGLIGWAFKTVARMGALQMKHARRARSAA